MAAASRLPIRLLFGSPSAHAASPLAQGERTEHGVGGAFSQIHAVTHSVQEIDQPLIIWSIAGVVHCSTHRSALSSIPSMWQHGSVADT